MRKGYVAPIEVFHALVQQRDQEASGKERRLIGEVLVDRGWLSPWELEDVLVTAADLGYSNRTGETPSDAIPVGRRLHSSGPPQKIARKLGARLTVREVMRRAVVTTPEAVLADALDLAQESGLDAPLVTDGEELVGALRVRDFLDTSRKTQVERCMTSPALTVHADAPVEEVAPLLRQHDLPCIAVVLRGRVVGMLTPDDFQHAGFPRPPADRTPLPYRDLGAGD
ncbi:CBS domain-containing protein [bacterium]|nr:CBS domain-containing protein [bacterium]